MVEPLRTSLDEVLERAGAAVPARAPDVFLTVVIRTQGTRPRLLAEAMASLSEQTDRDIEVIVVRHRADDAGAGAVDRVVATTTSWLREQTTVLDLATGARGAPLNLGFERARGSYVVALDDDDLVLPAWVAVFRALAERAPGQVLRANALQQDVEGDTVDGELIARPVREAFAAWPRRFELLDHLLTNHTPNMTAAFPREVFHALGERFDESLDTTEDWDFLLRAAAIVGVVSTDEITATYRWWVGSETSRSLHDEEQWALNHRLVQQRLDDRVLLLPPGSVSALQRLLAGPAERIEDLVAERDREAANAQQLLGEAQGYLARLNAAEERIRRQQAKLRRLRDGGSPS